MDLYAQNILDRYKSPLHKDKFSEGDAQRKEANHSCGDAVEISLRLKDGRIGAYSFSGQGCAISMAAADLLGDLLEGITGDEALALDFKDIQELLGIPIGLRRSKCALLPLLAVQNGILTKEGGKAKEWAEYRI